MVIVIIGILASLLLPAIARAIRNAKATRCSNNLSQLYKMQANYSTQYGGKNKWMPTETGGAFWLKLSKPGTLLIDATLADIYEWPLEAADTPGQTDYRGPWKNINDASVGDGDPIGADKDGNHGVGNGGSIIRKSGDVNNVGQTDSLWQQATTKCVP